jgi:AbiJ N-terminal domain 4
MKLFSKLQGGGKPDKLSYELPEGLRYQIVQIWEKGFGPDERHHPGPGMAYREIHRILCEEHQVPQLPQVSRRSLPLRGVIAEYFLNVEEPKALDVVQVVFSTMEKMLHRPVEMYGCFDDPFSLSNHYSPEIIDELNRRFSENNVGYQYQQGQIHKIHNDPAPVPVKERLVAGEPFENLRKLKAIIGGSTVTAIHDPYITAASLETILKLADMGAKFSPSLRILGTEKALSKPTEKKTFIGLIKDVKSERKVSWEFRVFPAGSRPHRRFLVLHDGSIVTCGMSLNHIDKDEVLDHESSGSENAKHDQDLFEQEWRTATPL